MGDLLVAIVGGIVSTVVGGLILAIIPSTRKNTPELRISLPSSADSCFTLIFVLALLAVVNTVYIQLWLSALGGSVVGIALGFMGWVLVNGMIIASTIKVFEKKG